MNKYDLAKRVVGFVAQSGAGTITHQIIKKNVEADSKTEEVTIAVGSYALGAAVGRVARDQIFAVADETRDAWRKLTGKKDQPEQ